MIRVLPLALALVGCAAKAPQIHTWTSGEAGFHTNSQWVDTGDEVVVFDAQFTPELARELLAEIQSSTDSPVRYVVVTHPNPDKFNGASVFQAAGAELVASEATAAAMPAVHEYKKAYFTSVGAFTEDTYPALPEVDRTFADTLELGQVRLSVLEHGGVTDTQTVAQVGSAVIAGDLLALRTHAWLEGSVSSGSPQPDIAEWIAALDELQALAPDGIAHGGRGEPLPIEVAVTEQTAYLSSMESLVADYVAELPAGALSAEDAGTHYAAIGELAAEAWPEHAHPYLVTYGVYGLALAQ